MFDETQKETRLEKIAQMSKRRRRLRSVTRLLLVISNASKHSERGDNLSRSANMKKAIKALERSHAHSAPETTHYLLGFAYSSMVNGIFQ